LEYYSDRLVNIHLGLSPYYRGSGTNFWPLVDGRPEFVGATLHVVAAKVDAGPILAQVRPQAEASDRAHELGTKTIISAAALMPRVLAAVRNGRAFPVVQDLSHGKVCRRRDFNAEAVRQMWRNFDSGMMDKYLAEIDQRHAASPIVELMEQVI
jgi:methionyl-tRNA formyltransferase